jgi:hypothetical protein
MRATVYPRGCSSDLAQRMAGCRCATCRLPVRFRCKPWDYEIGGLPVGWLQSSEAEANRFSTSTVPRKSSIDAQAFLPGGMSELVSDSGIVWSGTQDD